MPSLWGRRYLCGGHAAAVELSLIHICNRTAGDMRHYFDKYGGNLGQSGSVSWPLLANIQLTEPL